MAESHWCDNCNSKVAIYVQKKRAAGKLTRDQYCAYCLVQVCRATGQRKSDFTRITYNR